MTSAAIAAETQDITAKHAAVQANIDAMQADFKTKLDAAQAQLDVYAKRLAELAAMVPTDEPQQQMTPYFTDSQGKAVSVPFGNTTTDKIGGVGVSGIAGPATLHLDRNGWAGVTTKPTQSPYVIKNKFTAHTYNFAVTVGTKTTKYAFTVSDPAPVTPPAPPPQPNTPPTPQPQPVPSGRDPRTAYPVAFPYSPIPQDAQGWTAFKPSIDSKCVYVAPGGNDSAAGTFSSPVKTIAKAKSMMRSGFPDWIYLQRGSSYGDIGSWTVSGRSLSEPMVVAAYGTGARPIVGALTSPQGKTVNAVVFLDLNIYNASRDSTAKGFDLSKVTNDNFGIDWLASGNCIHFEGCRIAWWNYNVQLYGPSGFILRRCVIERAWISKGDKAQGLYVNNAAGDAHNGAPGPAMTIEENVIDHNGWNELVNGKPPKGNALGPWTFSHDVYGSEHSGPALFRRNIISRGADCGLNWRSGGVMEDNLFIDSSAQGYVGRMLQPANLDKECWIIKNVACNQNHGNGWAYETPFWAAGKVEDNLDLPRMSGSNAGYSIRIDPARSQPYIPGQPTYIPSSSLISVNRNYFTSTVNVWANKNHKVAGSGNIFPAGVALEFGSPAQPDFVEGKAWSKTAKFVDPSRDVSTYNARVLNRASDYNDFLSEAVKQQRTNWRTEYTASAVNDWIRAGFTVSA